MVSVVNNQLSLRVSELIHTRTRHIQPRFLLWIIVNSQVNNQPSVSRLSQLNASQFVLSFVISEEIKETSHWLPLDDDVNVDVKLQFDDFQEPNSAKRRSNMSLNSFRSLRRIKENWKQSRMETSKRKVLISNALIRLIITLQATFSISVKSKMKLCVVLHIWSAISVFSFSAKLETDVSSWTWSWYWTKALTTAAV